MDTETRQLLSEALKALDYLTGVVMHDWEWHHLEQEQSRLVRERLREALNEEKLT